MLALEEPPPTAPESAAPEPYRFTVEQYLAIWEAGLLGTDHRLELIEGVIQTMSPLGNRHTQLQFRLNRLLARIFPPEYCTGGGGAINLGTRTQLQPDGVVFKPEPTDYAGRIPTPADTILIAEVSDTTLRHDRVTKANLYAAAGVPEYWVLDAIGGRLFVHTNPSSEGYAQVLELKPGQVFQTAHLPGRDIAVSDLIPPVSG